MGRFTRAHYERFWTHEIDRLRPTGRDEMRGVCPVHGGDNPDTLLVHLDTGFAHCFKCHNDGEAWSMVDFARARYGTSADEAHRYVYEITGAASAGAVTVPWNFPFPQPLALTADGWQLGLLAKRIGDLEIKLKCKATALYVYEDCRAVKLRFLKAGGGKHMIWLALTDKGGWARLRTTGRTAALYRARALKDAAEVWLLNGEKAVDRAVKEWGVIATCLPNGEAHWKEEYLAWFAGIKAVYLPPDNDAVGGEHARIIGAALMRAGIETRIVTLDGLPPKGDLWDFIEAGGTLEGARTRALESPLADADYTPPAKERMPPGDNGHAPPPEGPDLITGYGYMEADNARRMMALGGGNLNHVQRLDDPWLVYNGVRWRSQPEYMVQPYAERAMRLLAAQANHAQDEKLWKWSQRSLNAAPLYAMIRLARNMADVDLDTFDREPWLINCPSGTYDAATGAWREHRREDRLTRLFPYDYNPSLAPPGLFLECLFEWLGGTADAGESECARLDQLIAYVRRWVAYCMTGWTEEKGLLVVHGEKGNNGKSTFLSTVQGTLGEYAVTIHASTLTKNPWRNSNNQLADIARTRGARAVFAGEPPSGEKFDQAAIKMLTQNEVPVTAVFKGRQPFQFLPTAKIVLETNRVPTFDTDDPAFLHRMHLLHFPREFRLEHGANGDRLRERLRGEEPAIFKWAVDGIGELRKLGLARPGAVAEDLRAIRDEQAREGDGEEPFLEHCFDFGPGCWCRVSVVAELRLRFMQQFGLRPIPKNALSRKLCERTGILRGNDSARDHKTPAWLRGLAPKPGMMTATVGQVLWGYDGTAGAERALQAEEEERQEAEDAYWKRWPRN